MAGAVRGLSNLAAPDRLLLPVLPTPEPLDRDRHAPSHAAALLSE